MAASSLLVVMYDRVIGHISQRSEAAEPEFEYDSDHLANGSTPLGVRLPLAEGVYRGKNLRAYLEGVLPEDPGTRQRWGTLLGVDPADTLAILARMGWDCPGAVQFCRPDELAEMQSRSQQLEPISDRGIAERIASLRTGDAPSWTLPGEHWSLPGQQSKFALARRRSGWHQAHGSAATTHIIKPGIGRLQHQALVEHATMRAARALGLDVAHTEFRSFDDEPAIVVERYDRLALDDGTVLRLHQEDFCSAGGRLPSRKYEAHGGPGLAALARILEQNVENRAAGLTALGRFVAFNYVAGAPDGHAKNLSLMLLPGETKVAPLYDLATSLAYSGDPALREVAVAIGGRRKFGQVLGKHWDRAAAVLGTRSEDYRRTVREMADAFPDAFTDALHEVGTPAADEVRQRSIDQIALHTKQLIGRLDDPVDPPVMRSSRAH